MAATWGSLGRQKPLAATLTTLYTVVAARHAGAFVIAANLGAASATIRIAHSPAGAAIADEHYLVYDFVLDAGKTQATLKFALAAGDIVRVYASTANVAFNLNGIEDAN